MENQHNMDREWISALEPRMRRASAQGVAVSVGVSVGVALGVRVIVGVMVGVSEGVGVGVNVTAGKSMGPIVPNPSSSRKIQPPSYCCRDVSGWLGAI